MIVRQPHQTISIDAEPNQGVRGRAAEEFHSLLRSLAWPATAASSGTPRLVGLTCCGEGEGVSTVAMQTAIAAAEASDQKVLIVDAHFARPSLHKSFTVARYPGLADYLTRDNDPKSCIRPSRFTNLWVMPAGQVEGDAARIYSSIGRFHELAGVLSRSFDLVVFDMPPVGNSDVSTQFLAELDAVVLVVESQRVRSDVAQRVTQRLHRAGAQVKGVILNKHQNPLPAWLDRAI